MLCPVCRQPMIIVEFNEIELDTCPDCRGLWFDAQELRELFELAGVPERLLDLESHLERLPHTPARRKCPRCRSRMFPVAAPGTEGKLILDECPDEHGLWFDEGELESLFTLLLGEGSSALDNVRQYLGQFLSVNRSADEAE